MTQVIKGEKVDDGNAPLDSKGLRRVLGHYPTGVCVITSIDLAGEPAAMVVGSFTSVSLDPPLVAFFPAKSSRSWARISQVDRFCVNILADDPLDLCAKLAGSERDKFKGVSHRLSQAGLPIINDVVAWIDCKLHDVHDAGDHQIVLGEIETLSTGRNCKPLLFFQGSYGQFSGLA